MQSVEYGPSGPTAVKDMDASSAGVSASIAAFIGANASPFTNPRDFPGPAKVPDPRNTQTTDTAFLWGHFDIPVVQLPGTGLYGSGEQLLITSADPLAPVPISWCNTMSESDVPAFYNGAVTPALSAIYPGLRTANTLARDYEVAGLSKLISQIHDLGTRAKTYRVVGHGLKVWVSKNSNVSRGNIEAGQYTVSGTTDKTIYDTMTRTTGTAFPGGVNSLYRTTMSTSLPLTMQSALMKTAAVNTLRASLRNGKDQELGFLAADEGATVRWTDTNEFAFMPTVQRSLVYPLKMNFPSGYDRYQNMYFGTDGAAAAIDRSNPLPMSTFNPVRYDSTAGVQKYVENNAIVPYGDINELCSFNGFPQGVNPTTYYAPPTWTSGLARQMNFYADANNRMYETVNSISDMHDYLVNPDWQFDKGLYADISGLDPSQVLTVQVCWHIEYTPRNNEAWSGETSPVDSSFDEVSALLRDRRAFPIVVKGHSFFSSLKKALGKAAAVVGKIFSAATPLLMGTGDPRLMAAGGVITSLQAAASAMSRKRQALEE